VNIVWLNQSSSSIALTEPVMLQLHNGSVLLHALPVPGND
jgi:hypothetical protein